MNINFSVNAKISHDSAEQHPCAVRAPEGDGAVVGAVVVEVSGAVKEARARPALVHEVGLRAVAGLALENIG